MKTTGENGSPWTLHKLPRASQTTHTRWSAAPLVFNFIGFNTPFCGWKGLQTPGDISSWLQSHSILRTALVPGPDFCSFQLGKTVLASHWCGKSTAGSGQNFSVTTLPWTGRGCHKCLLLLPIWWEKAREQELFLQVLRHCEIWLLLLLNTKLLKSFEANWLSICNMLVI